MENNYYGNPVSLPNSTLILVFGIISIVACCCYAVPGLVFGIIALVLAGKAGSLYNLEPANYTESSYKNVNAGKICAIIGVIFSALYILLLILSISLIGWETLNNPELLQEYMQQYINQ
ncbi:MAG: hypothetical protein LBI65_01425 [Candidatus Symbiothrix sp.]|jgi:ABC-type microcin C transport system permease subunit YejB|nr:hypothetical protein [Candidatus Symbiothrix sp.]